MIPRDHSGHGHRPKPTHLFGLVTYRLRNRLISGLIEIAHGFSNTKKAATPTMCCLVVKLSNCKRTISLLLLLQSFASRSTHTLKVCGCYLGRPSMFSNFYRFDLHNQNLCCTGKSTIKHQQKK
jgi:hypothetical protein